MEICIYKLCWRRVGLVSAAWGKEARLSRRSRGAARQWAGPQPIPRGAQRWPFGLSDWVFVPEHLTIRWCGCLLGTGRNSTVTVSSQHSPAAGRVMSVFCHSPLCPPSPIPQERTGQCIAMGGAGLGPYPHAFLEQDLTELVREDVLPFELQSSVLFWNFLFWSQHLGFQDFSYGIHRELLDWPKCYHSFSMKYN